MTNRQKTTAILVIFGLPLLMFILAAAYDAFLSRSSRDFYPPGSDEPLWYPQGFEPGQSGSENRLPAVLLIPGRFSINSDIRTKAEQIARYGYIVRVPDLYNGLVSRGIPGMRILMAITPRQVLEQRVIDSWEKLLNNPDVDVRRTGVTGFNLGADLALNLASADSRVSALTLFYPSELPALDEEMGDIGASGPVLLLGAADDRRVGGADIADFSSMLRAKGRSFRQVIYDNVGADFVRSDEFTRVGPGIRAWLEMLGFFQEYLQ